MKIISAKGKKGISPLKSELLYPEPNLPACLGRQGRTGTPCGIG